MTSTFPRKVTRLFTTQRGMIEVPENPRTNMKVRL
jgi:hypothetical protein